MHAATESDPPTVTLSFANNFWGKDDAGVTPLLDRMHHAKETSDQLKSFYNVRAAIEDEYARKLLALSRKPLGSGESGSLRMSLDVIRREVESMGKAHQNIANQMKTELEEPFTAFAGAMKERRKIVQGGIEKLLKLKVQQTAAVNKTRDKYEQDCLKIKGYLAQGHMVMGQEERKINAKLEKTKIQVSSTSTEYESAVKALEETTGRWNRDWKIACDKFQDLEEERIDFFKNNLWAFANIASTVCVSDDASCEKIRLSLEECEVQKDIFSFIKIQGTGQEIPDPPKFIDFCRGDATEHESDDGGFSTAQFQRPINPAHRTSSPQPSLLESHHDPHSTLIREMGGNSSGHESPAPDEYEELQQKQAGPGPYGQKSFANSWADVTRVPHNEHPQHGMTQFCRTGPASSGPPSSFAPSDLSSGVSQNRPESRDSYSEYSNPSRDSYEQRHSSAVPSPAKQVVEEPATKKSSRSWIKSPFRRPSKPEKDPQHTPTARSNNRNTWGASVSRKNGMDGNGNPSRRSIFGGNGARSPSPDPIDPNSKIQLNVGTNVFDVSTDANRNNMSHPPAPRGGVDDPYDPLVQALDELNRVASKASKSRDSADRHFQIPSPAPPRSSGGRASPLPAGAVHTPLAAAQRGTPPPSYDSPMGRSTLGAPPAAHTSREMQNTTSRYVNQRRGVYDSNSPTANRGQGQQPIRATSPAPGRRSPQPGMQQQQQYRPPSSQGFRGGDPAAQGGYDPNRGHPNAGSPQRPGYGAPPGPGGYGQRGGSPGMGGGAVPRARSPQPGWGGGGPPRPSSGMGGDMAMQVSRAGSPYGSMRGGGGPYDAAGVGPVSTHVRSKSVADARQYSKDGRPILQHARAMYMYQAQIPEELGFAKGEILAVLRLQDDGWWEAETVGRSGARGLVPSNYLQVVDR